MVFKPEKGNYMSKLSGQVALVTGCGRVADFTAGSICTDPRNNGDLLCHDLGQSGSRFLQATFSSLAIFNQEMNPQMTRTPYTA